MLEDACRGQLRMSAHKSSGDMSIHISGYFCLAYVQYIQTSYLTARGNPTYIVKYRHLYIPRQKIGRFSETQQTKSYLFLSIPI
jgi:hypothetical protein